MPRLQELIHTLEVGAGARYLRFAAILLGVVTMAVIYDLRQLQNLRSEEAMDAAQLARNIAEGRGFTTRYIRPLSMGMLMRHRADHDPQLKGEHPDIANPPLYPLVLAGFMKIPGLFEYDIVSPKEGKFRHYQPDFMIALINQTFFLFAILLLWRLTRRLFDSIAAFVASMVMLGSELLWQFSASGQWVMLGLLLISLLATVLFELDEGSRREAPRGLSLLILALLAGALCGLLGLTRYSLAVLIIPVVLYLIASCPGRRVVLPLAAIAAFLLVFTPWLVRNWQVCGMPFGVAGYSLFAETTAFPLNSLDRTLDPNLAGIGPSDIVRKAFVGARQLLSEDLPTLGGSWLSAFFAVGLLVPFVQPSRGRLRWFTIGAIAILGLAQILSRTHLSVDVPKVHSENLLVLMTPLVVMFGAALVTLLVRSIEVTVAAWRTIILGLVMAVLWLPLVVSFGPPRTYPVAYPPYYPPMIRPLKTWFAPQELIMSDMPWAVAWYAERPSILLSRTPDKDFIQINDWMKTINGLYLTRLTLDQRYITGWLLNAREWGRFMMEMLHKSQVPTGFPLRRSPYFPSTFPHYLLLADRERWDNANLARPPKNADEKNDKEEKEEKTSP